VGHQEKSKEKPLVNFMQRVPVYDANRRKSLNLIAGICGFDSSVEKWARADSEKWAFSSLTCSSINALHPFHRLLRDPQ
jgi:hypothetical protein